MNIREFIEANPNARAKLDELVIEQASYMACAANNDGVGAQIEFLNNLRNMSDEEIMAVLRG